MSILRKCFDASTIRKLGIFRSVYCISAPLSTAREISELSHKKVLKYVLRKQLKLCMNRTTIEEKPPKLHILRDVIIKEQKWEMTDIPGTNEILLRKELNDEIITVSFEAWYPEPLKEKFEQTFDIKIIKSDKATKSKGHYFIFQFTTNPELTTVGGKYYTVGADVTDEGEGFEPTHSRQPEQITNYVECTLFERGIDYDLALFVRLESERKCTRERTFALKGLIDFLNNEEYLD